MKSIKDLYKLHTRFFYNTHSAAKEFRDAYDFNYPPTQAHVAKYDASANRFRELFRLYCDLIDEAYFDPIPYYPLGTRGNDFFELARKFDECSGIRMLAQACMTIASEWKTALNHVKGSFDKYRVAVVCDGKLMGYARQTKRGVNRRDVQALFPTQTRTHLLSTHAIKLYLTGFDKYSEELKVTYNTLQP